MIIASVLQTRVFVGMSVCTVHCVLLLAVAHVCGAQPTYCTMPFTYRCTTAELCPAARNTPAALCPLAARYTHTCCALSFPMSCGMWVQAPLPLKRLQGSG